MVLEGSTELDNHLLRLSCEPFTWLRWVTQTKVVSSRRKWWMLPAWLCGNRWVFPKMVVPPKHPKWSFLVGKPMVVGYQHFRNPQVELEWILTVCHFMFLSSTRQRHGFCAVIVPWCPSFDRGTLSVHHQSQLNLLHTCMHAHQRSGYELYTCVRHGLRKKGSVFCF